MLVGHAIPAVGRVTIHLVWRKGALTQGPARAFAETIKNRLKR